MIGAWIDLWAEREHPRSLGLVRILLGLVLLADLVHLAALDLQRPFFAPLANGGWTDLSAHGALPWFFQLPTDGIVWPFVLLFAATLSFTLGFFTRTSTAVLLLTWASFATAVPIADRAVDLLCRDFLLLLVFADAGAWGSLDARWRTGSVWGDGSPVAAWPRYLLIAQLIVLYGAAGLQKTHASWWPWGGCTALFVILQDPAVTRFDMGWLRNAGLWRLTQPMTLVTVLWQLLYPLLLVWLIAERTAERGGWRAWATRLHLHHVWIAVGVVFHLLLAATMELGIFPWAMMAVYPALLPPRSLARLP